MEPRANNAAIRLKVLHRRSRLARNGRPQLLSEPRSHAVHRGHADLVSQVRRCPDHYLAAEGITDVEAITADHLRGFWCTLERGLADRTIHHHASAAGAFCNYLVEEGLLAAAP